MRRRYVRERRYATQFACRARHAMLRRARLRTGAPPPHFSFAHDVAPARLRSSRAAMRYGAARCGTCRRYAHVRRRQKCKSMPRRLCARAMPPTYAISFVGCRRATDLSINASVARTTADDPTFAARVLPMRCRVQRAAATPPPRARRVADAADLRHAAAICTKMRARRLPPKRDAEFARHFAPKPPRDVRRAPDLMFVDAAMMARFATFSAAFAFRATRADAAPPRQTIFRARRRRS